MYICEKKDRCGLFEHGYVQEEKKEIYYEQKKEIYSVQKKKKLNNDYLHIYRLLTIG